MAFSTETFLNDLKDLVEIESHTSDVEGITQIVDYFEGRFKDLGWDTEVIPTNDSTGPILKCCNKKTGHYDITFMGHMDTVFPKGIIQAFPFSRDNEYVYGPGVADMKQGDLMMYYLAKYVPNLKERNVSVCMLFTPDEETSSTASVPHLRTIAQHSDAVIVMEAGWINGDRCISRNGKYCAHIVFEGIAAHSGYIGGCTMDKSTDGSPK